MRLWVFAAMGFLVCLGVPRLILNSAEAFGQMPDGRLVDQPLAFRQRHGRAAMPNPASVHCERHGGRVEVVNGTGGQTGYCHLPNGTVVEEWAYFHGR